MTTNIESFPHFGETCVNDGRLIPLTFWLLAFFAVTIIPIIVFMLTR